MKLKENQNLTKTLLANEEFLCCRNISQIMGFLKGMKSSFIRSSRQRLGGLPGGRKIAVLEKSC